jgi:hypothetical protein
MVYLLIRIRILKVGGAGEERQDAERLWPLRNASVFGKLE